MCRNIRTLFNFEPPATDDEIRAASLQFVRKLSGFNKPSQANAAAFNRAVDEVSDAAGRLIASLETTAPRATAQWRRRRRASGQGLGSGEKVFRKSFPPRRPAAHVVRHAGEALNLGLIFCSCFVQMPGRWGVSRDGRRPRTLPSN